MTKKNNRSLNMSEQELQEMLNRNKNIKIASATPMGKSAVINALQSDKEKEFFKKPKKSKNKVVHDFFQTQDLNTAEPKTKKALGINVKEKILDVNRKSIITTNHSSEHLSILFEGARLLSVNQIFSILQYRKFEIFAYKKMWQELVEKALAPLKDLPFFEKDCEIILLVQNAKLVDTDALSVMFKYIIDALKQDKKEPLKPAVLSEDNPKVVHNIRFIQYKGKENWVGIRLQKSIQQQEELDTQKFLNPKKI